MGVDEQSLFNEGELVLAKPQPSFLFDTAVICYSWGEHILSFRRISRSPLYVSLLLSYVGTTYDNE